MSDSAVCNQSLCDLLPPKCKYGEKLVSYYRQDSCCPDFVCGESSFWSINKIVNDLNERSQIHFLMHFFYFYKMFINCGSLFVGVG